jgi:hypothetical protein
VNLEIGKADLAKTNLLKLFTIVNPDTLLPWRLRQDEFYPLLRGLEIREEPLGWL